METREEIVAGYTDTARAEAFSDAVLAIIITLLALDLRPQAPPPGRLLVGLLENWPAYVAYFASYMYVAVVWLNHKAAFKRIRLVDWGLHWANQIVLFTTALLPFATVVMADAFRQTVPADRQSAIGLYALVGLLLCASWLWFFHYVGRHPHVLHENIDEGFFLAERIRAIVGIGLYALGGTLGYLLSPTAALVIFVGVPIFYAFSSEGLYSLSKGRPGRG